MRLSVFEKSKLHGGYLDVNRGSDNRTEWNSIIGSFVISKSSNNINIMGKKLRHMTMQLTCMEEEGMEILTENILNKNFIWKISSQT